jgi:Flp pilus assembly protein CpaB
LLVRRRGETVSTHRRAAILALVTSLLGAGVLRLYLARYESEIAGGPPTRVLALTKDAAPGAALDRGMLAVRELPQRYLESRHVRAEDFDKVLGARLALPARATEALLWTDLQSLREGARRLSALVPEGMRAFALAPALQAQAALLAPGDRVDVLVTPPVASGQTGRAQIAAESLLVLAVGQDLGAAAAGAASAPRQGLVTLAATPEQCLRLAAAERQGALRLVLRNPDENAVSAAAWPAAMAGPESAR